jgi:hypothetical protein
MKAPPPKFMINALIWNYRLMYLCVKHYGMD